MLDYYNLFFLIRQAFFPTFSEKFLSFMILFFLPLFCLQILPKCPVRFKKLFETGKKRFIPISRTTLRTKMQSLHILHFESLPQALPPLLFVKNIPILS